MVLNTEWAQVEEIELVNDGSGLAFGIIGGRSTGVVVKTILPGGVASRDGRLQSGDHILQIGEVQLRGMGSEQAAAVLRQCGVHVKLLVARPVEPTSQDYQALGSHAPIVPTRLLGDPEQLGRHLLELGYSGGMSAAFPDHYVIRTDSNNLLSQSTIIDVVRNPLPIGPAPLIPAGIQPHIPGALPQHLAGLNSNMTPPNMLPLDMAVQGATSPDGGMVDIVEQITVTLHKSNGLGLGITVAGYVCEKEELSGIFVKSISEGSSAYLSKQIQVNDRIVEVDGKSLHAHSNPQAVQLLRNTGSHVTLRLERYLRGPKLEHLRRALCAQQPLRAPSPPSPSVTSLPKYSVSIDGYSFLDTETSIAEPEFEPVPEVPETPTNEDVEIVITGAAGEQHSPSDDHRTPGLILTAVQKALKGKWEAELDDVLVVIADIRKDFGGGLGISLEGTVDVECGREVRPHHYIRSVMPGGPVARSGVLQAGDELLEVNGVRLLGLHHLEVVATLKSLPRDVTLVCSRKQEIGYASRVINTAQHREAFAARSILGGSLQTLLPPPERLVKAKSESSLASFAHSNLSVTPSNTAEISMAESRCRSLENIASLGGVAMWRETSEKVELIKGDHGLGFSILDYQDPMEPSKTVIVIRSLICGGVAAADGRLLPGDRLISVNGVSVAREPLHRAVQALKAAPKGKVVIEVAKPMAHNSQDSPEEVSRTSEDHTCQDDFHECLDSYGEGLEVVQICLEAHDEDGSISNDLSTLDDLSDAINNTSGMRKSDTMVGDCLNLPDNDILVNGRRIDDFEFSDSNHLQSTTETSKANRILTISTPNDNQQNGHNNESEDADTTASESNPKIYPENYEEYPKNFSREHSKEISTSDEMVFAVTPTGLERISFEKYWKDVEVDNNLERIHSDESWKDCRSQICSPNTKSPAVERKNVNLSVNNLKFIDHDDDLDIVKSDFKSEINVNVNSENNKSENIKISDNFRVTCSLTNVSNVQNNNCSFKSQQVLNKSVVRVHRLQEYYNDHEQCLEEYRRQKQLKLQGKLTPLEDLTKDDNKNTVKSVAKTEELKKSGERKDVRFSEHLTPSNIKVGVVSSRQNVNKIDNLSSNSNILYNSAQNVDCNLNLAPNKIKSTENVSRVTKIIKTEVIYDDISNTLVTLKEANLLPKDFGEEHVPSNTDEVNVSTPSEVVEAAQIPEAKPLVPIIKKPKTLDFLQEIKYPIELDEEDQGDEIECHQCFIESIIAEQNGEVERHQSEEKDVEDHCQFCEALRAMLEHRLVLPDRRVSAPAILDLSYPIMTYDPGPVGDKNRRKSTGPLAFCCEIPPMTVTRSYVNGGAPRLGDEDVGSSMNSRRPEDRHWGPERLVEVLREPHSSLGISIVGGKVDLNSGADSSAIAGIFIKNVVPHSPAGRTGEFQTGDRILEVDGINVRTASHERAVEIIRGSGNPVTFLVQSLVSWSQSNGSINQGPSPSPSIKIKKAPPPPNRNSPNTPEPELIQAGVKQFPNQYPETQRKSSIKVPSIKMTSHDDDVTASSQENGEHHKEEQSGDVSSPKAPRSAVSSDEDSEDSDEEDVRDLEGRTYSAKGQEIDRASAANVRRSKEEIDADKEEEDDFGYTTNKVRKKYGPLGHTVVQVQIERGPAGLGLSLAGHRDRTMMAVFVCGMHPQGAAAKAGQVQVGDEILEVNGVVLHGRCHLNASAIIKGLSGPIFKFILLRRKAALEDVAVKPITQFPVSLEDEGDYSSFKNVRTVTIKKGSQSLGIMIIEGKHAEVGQGIFVSDIQEGSAAEVAGLNVGDMILAVNKDTLLGSGYDAAASMLKKTEGIVVLTVCNPNKKEDAESPADGAPTDLSRPVTPAGKPAPSPAKAEPVADPAVATINPNKETLIEINSENKSLGVAILGGKDTQVTGGCVVHEVYPDTPAGKDGRLKPGDQILECNGIKITPEMTHEKVLLAVRQNQAKVKILVYRPEPIETTKIDVELVKKPGKGLGICLMARKSAPGVFVSDIIHGSAADVDGKIAIGDNLVSVCGANVSEASAEECAAHLKSAAGKVAISLARAKPTKR